MVWLERWSKLNIENRMKVKVHNYRNKKYRDKNENTPNLEGSKLKSTGVFPDSGAGAIAGAGLSNF